MMRKVLLLAVVALVLAVPKASFADNRRGDGGWDLPKFRPVPTPEPATILLVAGGVGAAAVRKLRRRRQ